MTMRNRTVKKPNRPFGEGAYDGVIAPEAANNAAIGGALIPLLTFGIPGDAVTAIFIGALFIHGLQPGPLFMEKSGDLFWMMVGFATLANIFLLIFGLLVVSIFIRIITVPNQILLPIIAVITVIGSYALTIASLMCIGCWIRDHWIFYENTQFPCRTSRSRDYSRSTRRYLISTSIYEF